MDKKKKICSFILGAALPNKLLIYAWLDLTLMEDNGKALINLSAEGLSCFLL